jgi:hypothetical protein
VGGRILTGLWGGWLWCVGLLGSVGCVDIRGGAVELSWIVRTQSGAALGDGSTIDGCRLAAIAQVRLRLEPLDGAPAACGAPTGGGGDSCTFECARGGGATHFSIPQGTYRVSVEARCSDGSAATTAPPPSVVRRVVDGEITSLEVFEIAVGSTAACES